MHLGFSPCPSPQPPGLLRRGPALCLRHCGGGAPADCRPPTQTASWPQTRLTGLLLLFKIGFFSCMILSETESTFKSLQRLQSMRRVHGRGFQQLRIPGLRSPAATTHSITRKPTVTLDFPGCFQTKNSAGAKASLSSCTGQHSLSFL